jgi:hypothetical protein
VGTDDLTQEDHMTKGRTESPNHERRRPAGPGSRPAIPNIVAGEWRAELLGGSLHLGGTVNQAPAPHAIEFSFMTISACAYGPGRVVLPAVIVLMPPAESLEYAHVGSLVQNGPAAMIDLYVTRPLFSDLVQRIESGKAKLIIFKVEDSDGSKWPISLWSIKASLALAR